MPHVEVNKFRFLTEVEPSSARKERSSMGAGNTKQQAMSARTAATGNELFAKRSFGKQWRKELSTMTELLPMSAGPKGKNHHVPKPLSGSLLHPLVERETAQQQLEKLMASKAGPMTRFVRGDQTKDSVGTYVAGLVGNKTSSTQLAITNTTRLPGDMIVRDPEHGATEQQVLEARVAGATSGPTVVLPKLAHWMPGRSLAMERCDQAAQRDCEEARVDALLGQTAENAAAKHQGTMQVDARPTSVTFGEAAAKGPHPEIHAEGGGELTSSPGSRGASQGSQQNSSTLGSTFGKVEQSAYYEKSGSHYEKSGSRGTATHSRTNSDVLGPRPILKPSSKSQNKKDMLPPLSLDEQAAETRAALTRIGEDLLYQMAAVHPQMDYIKEARLYAEPYDPLPSKKRFLHLHTMNAIKQADNSDALLDDGVGSIGRAALTKSDREVMEQILASGLSGGGSVAQRKAGAGRGEFSTEEEEDPADDQPPLDTKWKYLLTKNSQQPEASARQPQLEGLSRTTGGSVASHKAKKGDAKNDVETSTQNRSSFDQSKKSLPTMPQKPKPMAMAGLKSRKLQPLGSSSATPHAKSGKHLPPDSPGSADDDGDDAGMNADELKIQELTRELVQYSDGSVSLAFVSAEVSKDAERKRRCITDRHKGAAAKMSKRVELHERTRGGDANHPDVQRLLVARKGASIGQEDGDVLANLKLYGREPTLFEITGEDTDVKDFPDFPFAGQPEMSGPNQGAALAAVSDGELTDEEKLHRKFERRLLVRQMQRNREIVDDQDNPQLDWASWRAAANNAVKTFKQATREEVAESMTFQWRQRIEEMKPPPGPVGNKKPLTGADIYSELPPVKEKVKMELPCLAAESILHGGLNKK